MLFYFLLLGSTLAYPQVTIKPDVLIDVFGTPPTTKKVPGLEDVSIQ
ncbi:hypothetical protein RR48_00309 [Papilio machaon]|uniref:Uncharacterized protein n=1 Tax=Papilio machaon TaxID=76193 RepID=A0A0N1IKV8_PAPMA|nr:hypothetical protein RR48_00309 [Papilio machaon]